MTLKNIITSTLIKTVRPVRYRDIKHRLKTLTSTSEKDGIKIDEDLEFRISYAPEKAILTSWLELELISLKLLKYQGIKINRSGAEKFIYHLASSNFIGKDDVKNFSLLMELKNSIITENSMNPSVRSAMPA